jgi:lipoprotein NlpD
MRDATTNRMNRFVSRAAAMVLASLLAACGSTSHRAPVEERAAKPSTPVAAAPAAAPASAPAADLQPPKAPADNAGRAGYYTVKPGDTLIRVGLENGQNWRDIARWNNIENPNIIEVGQVLRVLPPGVDANAVVTRPVSPGGRVDPKALGAAGAASAPPVVAAASAPTTGAPAPAPAPPLQPDEDLGWIWPAAGPVAAGFDEAKTKGVQIAGKAGDPVYAAADGRVVYAGSGLRGYGNLIIVKHNNTFLSAYAHNQALLVKEDQVVRKGQKIAEMGSSDAERVQLHFEIRRQGKPIDPARLLPAR